MLSSGLVAHGRLAPRSNRGRTSDRRLAFSTAVRVVAGVHNRSANGRPYAHVALSARLAQVHVFVINVSYLTDGSHAVGGNVTHLTGGESYQYSCALTAHKLCHVSGGSYELCALAGVKLDVVNKCTNGDVDKGKSVSGLDVCLCACADCVAYFKAVGSQDVSLLTVLVLYKSDVSRTVGIVL